MKPETLRSCIDLDGKIYKVFLVEEDDDDRERVLAGRCRAVEITTQPNWADIHSDYSQYPVASYVTHTDMTMTLEMVPHSDGTLFRIEDFSVSDEIENFMEEEE